MLDDEGMRQAAPENTFFLLVERLKKAIGARGRKQKRWLAIPSIPSVGVIDGFLRVGG